MNLKIECHEANHLCDKNQYKEATFWEKVRLNIHLIYCRSCRKYTVRNGKLTKVIKSKEVRSVSPADKNALKERLKQEVSE
jgi:predicted anti-sigma-YlaC factor YlaD